MSSYQSLPVENSVNGSEMCYENGSYTDTVIKSVHKPDTSVGSQFFTVAIFKEIVTLLMNY